MRSLLPAFPALLLLASTAAPAQETDDPEAQVADEITVTAQRVEETLQDVPISIVTLSGEELENRGITDVQGIADAAPGVVVSGHSSTTGEVSVTIRGVGSNTFGLGTESTVGYYVDGVYMPRPQSFASPLLDLERVEVLRGPQGTLWGRNSTGGALNLVTRAPEGAFQGRVVAGASEYDSVDSASGQRYGISLNGPLTRSVWARLSHSVVDVEDATWNQHLSNRNDNLDGSSSRLGLTLAPGDATVITLRGDRTANDSHNNFQLKAGTNAPESLVGALNSFYGYSDPTDVHAIAANIAPLSDYEESGFSLHVDHVFSPSLSLSSITSARDLDSNRRSDVDASPLDFVENHGAYESDWRSQEIQLRGDTGRARWIAGLYAFEEEGHTLTDTRSDTALFGVWLFATNPATFLFDPNSYCSLGFLAPATLCGPAYYVAVAPFLGLPVPGTVTSGNFFDTTLDSSARAAFGQVDWTLSDRVTLTTGVRYTEDEKTHTQSTIDFVTLAPSTETLSDDWSAVTPKLGIEVRPNDDLMLYGAVTTGYKSGGFNSISLQPAFDEETVDSYEIGLKSTVARGVTFNASAFSYDYDDLQVAVLYPDRSTVENAASASIAGFDLELRVRPNPRLAFDVSLEVLDDEFDQFTSQNPLDVADLTYAAIAAGTLDLTAALAAGAFAPTTDLSGNGLPQAPDLSASASLAYTFDLGGAGSLTARGEYQYSDDIAFDAFEEFVQPSYSLVHGYLRWSPAAASFQVNLYGRNLTDEEYRVTEFFTNYTGTLRVWAPPREIGIQVGFDF